jgi:phage-related minor tail protein
MSATSVSIRLGLEGGAQVKRAFAEIGQSGKEAFGSVEAALKRTGTTSDAELARYKRLAEVAARGGEAFAARIAAVGTSSRLTRNHLQTLQYTVNDVVASLASGASPMTILMQQGGQLTQAFGGLRGTLATLGSTLGIVGGLTTGAAVAAAGLTAAWIANNASTRAVTAALMGAGRASGTTAIELERLARTAADTGNLSVMAARDMEAAFLSSGKIGANEIGQAIGAVRNFAATMGIDATAAAQQLATALADPARGADELNQRLSFLDDRTRQLIRTLVDQNDRTEAQRVLLDALIPSLGNAEQATSAFGRAWNFVAQQASNAFNAIGRTVERPVNGRSPAEELELLKWQRDRLRENISGNVVPLMLPQVEKRIAEIEGQLADQQKRAAQLASEARANELSVKAGEVARDVLPGAREMERWRSQQATLGAALNDPQTRAKLANLDQVQAAYRQVTENIKAGPEGLKKRRSTLGAESRSELAASRTLADQKDQIAILQTEIALVGKSAQERETIIAELRAEHDLRARGIALASADGRATVENAGRIARLTEELQRQEAAYREIEGVPVPSSAM